MNSTHKFSRQQQTFPLNRNETDNQMSNFYEQHIVLLLVFDAFINCTYNMNVVDTYLNEVNLVFVVYFAESGEFNSNFLVSTF